MNKIESLEEVRRWKRQIYEEQKHLSREESLKVFQARMRELMKQQPYCDLEIISPKETKSESKSA